MLSRRLILGLAAVAPIGCASKPQPLPDAPNPEAKPRVLVAMPEVMPFDAVRRALIQEVKGSFSVMTFSVDANTTVDDLAQVIERSRPSCVVLMNNATVGLYQRYQKAQSSRRPFPAAVIVVASFVNVLKAGLENATGIAYEVPIPTMFVNLSSMLAGRIDRVGVVYREGLGEFIQYHRDLAAREQVELVAMQVPAQPTALEITSALRALETRKVNALWILNDNRLLKNGEFLENVWRPSVAKMKIPVVMGIPTLISSELGVGTFAIVPDEAALGAQTADLIASLAENGWRADRHPVEPPVSTVTVLDIHQARARFHLNKDALDWVDRTVD